MQYAVTLFVEHAPAPLRASGKAHGHARMDSAPHTPQTAYRDRGTQPKRPAATAAWATGAGSGGHTPGAGRAREGGRNANECVTEMGGRAGDAARAGEAVIHNRT